MTDSSRVSVLVRNSLWLMYELHLQRTDKQAVGGSVCSESDGLITVFTSLKVCSTDRSGVSVVFGSNSVNIMAQQAS